MKGEHSGCGSEMTPSCEWNIKMMVQGLLYFIPKELPVIELWDVVSLLKQYTSTGQRTDTYSLKRFHRSSTKS